VGFHARQRRGESPLFAGLPEPIIVREMHAYQMLEPPPGFDLLASSPNCRVQAIKDPKRIVYGVQCHPEAYDDAHPHGRKILENFFRLALGKPGR
jgi:GMP synthase-like glutamine amidotransferase